MNPRTRNRTARCLAAALALAAACSPPLESETTVNGRKVVVKGGHEQTVTQEEGRTTIQIDGHRVVIAGDTIRVNGVSRPLPDFQRLEIVVHGSDIALHYEGGGEGRGAAPAAAPPGPRSGEVQPAAAGPRPLPAGFRQAAVPGGGHALYRLEGGATPPAALGRALRRLAPYFDHGIESAEGFAERGGGARASFAATLGGHPVAGVAIAYPTPRGTAVGLAFDRAGRMGERVAPLLAALEQALPRPQATPPREAPRAWRWVPFPDGSGRVRLPEGWQIRSTYQGAVDIVGPHGEGISLGFSLPIPTPEAAANPLTGQPMPGVVAAYPADPVTSLRELGPRLVARFGGSFQVERVIEAAPVASPTGGRAAYVLYDCTLQGRAMRALSLIDCSPAPTGWWTYYYSTVGAPRPAFAKALPVMMKIWESWAVDPEVFRRRLQSALRAMEQTHRLLREAAENRTRSFEKGLVDWTEVFRGDRAVRDTLTGETRYTDIGWARKRVEKLNELAGYPRFREIPLRELMGE